MHPIPKHLLGSSGIRCLFNGGTGTKVGYIVKQTGMKRFVITDGSTTATCLLAQDLTTANNLPIGYCTIQTTINGSVVEHVKSLASTRCTTLEGHAYPWHLGAFGSGVAKFITGYTLTTVKLFDTITGQDANGYDGPSTSGTNYVFSSFYRPANVSVDSIKAVMYTDYDPDPAQHYATNFYILPDDGSGRTYLDTLHSTSTASDAADFLAQSFYVPSPKNLSVSLSLVTTGTTGSVKIYLVPDDASGGIDSAGNPMSLADGTKLTGFDPSSILLATVPDNQISTNPAAPTVRTISVSAAQLAQADAASGDSGFGEYWIGIERTGGSHVAWMFAHANEGVGITGQWYFDTANGAVFGSASEAYGSGTPLRMSVTTTEDNNIAGKPVGFPVVKGGTFLGKVLDSQLAGLSNTGVGRQFTFTATTLPSTTNGIYWVAADFLTGNGQEFSIGNVLYNPNGSGVGTVNQKYANDALGKSLPDDGSQLDGQGAYEIIVSGSQINYPY